jgi:pimeloyl-ACP methyl ester carboxylesterase
MNARRVAAASLAASLAVSFAAATAKDGAAIEVVPLVLIHGHGSDPTAWDVFMGRYGTGRKVVTALYANEADQLKPGDLPLASVVAAGYYMDSINDPVYGNKNGDIGSCPVARDDAWAKNYTASFAARIQHIVDGVCRASGATHVDLALHSMGNLVGRAYTKWLSAQGGKCKVRRLLMIVGPQRGINALEASVDGLDHHNMGRDFMDMGEVSEMCSEYKPYNGQAFVDVLNDNWDGFCSSNGVQYAGFSASGAVGTQIDPTDPTDSSDPSILGMKVTGAYGDILSAVEQIRTSDIPDIKPFVDIWGGFTYDKVLGPIGYPEPNLVNEIEVAFGPGDGTVRLASSRLDQAPFGQTVSWGTFEGRHGGDDWDPEQCSENSTFATELAREFCFCGNVQKGGHVDRCQLEKYDSPGKATFLALETTVSGAPLVSAQIVEQTLDATGKIDAKLTTASYACPLPLGTQRAFIQIPAGGGQRTYRVVLYGPNGAVSTQDNIVMQLTDGVLEAPPKTTFGSDPAGKPLSIGLVNALSGVANPNSTTNPAAPTKGVVVHVTASSNTASTDPTLRFSFRLDDGDWTPYATQASYDTPPLAPGEHRVEARSRHGNNGAKVVCDDAYGDAIGILVDSKDGFTIRH